eukprot:gnl/Chilomastix_caulleri/4689.p1 GENE.gnl/Chilomastix_caulleri/4689~~gnl/Chilomastix_caulleri/4689.p1  ORF type:complete len:181 (+),score=33.49 gnl/Chilomastix_caulleri/4689:59-601(+)
MQSIPNVEMSRRQIKEENNDTSIVDAITRLKSHYDSNINELTNHVKFQYNTIIKDEMDKEFIVNMDFMEAYFNPNRFGIDKTPVQDIVVKALMTLDHNLRRLLSSNIYICGSTAKCPGLSQRLQNEIDYLLSSVDMLDSVTSIDKYKYKVGVKVANSAGRSSWLGGLVESQEIKSGAIDG